MPRIDLDALRAYRQVEPLADAYRKPGCYGSIRHLATATTLCAPQSTPLTHGRCPARNACPTRRPPDLYGCPST